MARLPSSDLSNSLAVVLVNGPVAPLTFLGTVPDPASATAGGAFFAAGGADRGRDRDLFALGGGSGRRAFVGLLVAGLVADINQSVLLGAFAHSALAHRCL